MKRVPRTLTLKAAVFNAVEVHSLPQVLAAVSKTGPINVGAFMIRIGLGL